MTETDIVRAEIRADVPPNSMSAEIHAILQSIPIGSSYYIEYHDPRDLIKYFRFAMRTRHKYQSTRYSAWLVSSYGQRVRPGEEPVGIQIWHTLGDGTPDQEE